jgi:hypothetical protein
MPNIENLEKRSFTKNTRDNLLNVHRKDILYREDIKTSFGYALAGITVSLALAGGVYVIGKQLLK